MKIALFLFSILLTACAAPKEDRVWYAYDIGATTTTSGKIAFKGNGEFEMSIVQAPNGSSDATVQSAKCGTYFGGSSWASVDTTDGEVIDIKTRDQFYRQPEGNIPKLLFERSSSNKDAAEALIQNHWGGC